MAGLAQRHVAELNKHVRDLLDFKDEDSRVIHLTQVIEEQHAWIVFSYLGILLIICMYETNGDYRFYLLFGLVYFI